MCAPDPNQTKFLGELIKSAEACKVVPITCAGCGETFEPRRPNQGCCSATCRKRLERRKKRDIGPVDVSQSAQSVTRAPASLSAAVADHQEAEWRPTLKPCIRPGFPSGLLEGVDGDGLPIFIGNIGPLIRVWGGKLSDLQLGNMRLETAELVFPGGVFLSRLDDGQPSGGC